jgi:general secretion pathway protein F
MAFTATNSRPLRSQEVLALCDELRAMVQARVPLPLGLRTSTGVTTRQAELMERLAQRLEAGDTLDAALTGEGRMLPAPLRAIVIAGVKTGRLDELLGDLSETSRLLVELRGTLLRGLIYPAFLVLLGGWLAVMVFPQLARQLALVSEGQATVGAAVWGSEAGRYALIGFSMIILGCAGIWGWQSFFSPGISGWEKLSLLPGIGRVSRDSSLARGVHLLAVLARYGVPLPEALRLSAEGIGNGMVRREFLLLAEELEAGQPPNFAAGSGLPSFLRWMIQQGYRESRLPAALQEAANYYRDRATSGAIWNAKLLPALALVVLGGGVALIYGLSVMSSIANVLRQLGGPG